MRKLIVICCLLPIFSYGQIDFDQLLIARNTGTKVLSNGQTIGTMGFAYDLNDNPLIPGPLLEMNEGDSAHIDLWNVSQGAPHTIHLHGLDVDQQNDGVPHLSFDVAHMDHGDYYFKAPHAGTYLYHCHVVSSVHVQAGMYGMIIVHPPDGSKNTWDGGYPYDVSMPILFSEIDTVWHNDTIMKHDHDTSQVYHTLEVPDYHPQFYLINGYSDGQIADSSMQLNTSVGAVNYLRFANIGYKGCRVIFPSVFGADIIASDGRPLSSNVVSDTLEIYPGERFGVLGSMPAEGLNQIAVEYFDLNTGVIESTQFLPIIVEGYVGLKEIPMPEMQMMLYPNPTSGSFVVQTVLNNDSSVRLRLTDLKGQVIENFNFETTASAGEWQKEFSTATLTPGMYIVQLTVDNGQTISRKLSVL